MKRHLLIVAPCLLLLSACAHSTAQDEDKDCMQLYFGDNTICGGIHPDGPPFQVPESSLGEEYYFSALCDYLFFSCKRSCGNE
jgi:hypothetical protein